MRYLGHILAAVVVLTAGGCGGKSEDATPIWEQTKIWELAPAESDPAESEFLIAARFNVFVFDIPAENIDQLQDMWPLLSAQPIQTNSYTAFSQNYFRVRFGQASILDKLATTLAAAGGQAATTVSIDLPSDAPADLPVTPLPRTGTISFAESNLSWQQAKVQPGQLALRLVAEPIPGARGARKIVAYPVATPGLTSTIPELNDQVRQREFYFASAAFAAQMGPGDLLVLGPNEYTPERVTLGGLFFNEPQDVLFANPTSATAPQLVPAIRVFVLLCVGMID
jgi:hypothetical protein